LRSFGETLAFTAVALDQHGAPMPDRTSVTWRSSLATTASVDNAGLVTARQKGTVTISAEIEGVVGRATIHATQVPASLAFTTQPEMRQAGATLPEILLTLFDAQGNIVSDAMDEVTLSLEPNPGAGTLAGTATTLAQGGVARFAGLSVSAAGASYRLLASSGTLPHAASNAFDVIAEAARFDSLKLSSTVIPIAGIGVPYRAWVTNGSNRTLHTAGLQTWISQGTALRASGGIMASECGGNWQIPPGSCLIEFRLVPSNTGRGTGTLEPGPATARFDLFERDDTVATVEVLVMLETYVPPPPPPIVFDSVKLESTTLTLGELAGVSYIFSVTNTGAQPIPNIILQGWVDQGTASRAGGGTMSNCTGEIGVVPVGKCDIRFSLGAGNSGGGTGTLVPGAATARFELKWDHGVFLTATVPITLVAP
jgi:hypothetical protein